MLRIPSTSNFPVIPAIKLDFNMGFDDQVTANDPYERCFGWNVRYSGDSLFAGRLTPGSVQPLVVLPETFLSNLVDGVDTEKRYDLSGLFAPRNELYDWVVDYDRYGNPITDLIHRHKAHDSLRERSVVHHKVHGSLTAWPQPFHDWVLSTSSYLGYLDYYFGGRLYLPSFVNPTTHEMTWYDSVLASPTADYSQGAIPDIYKLNRVANPATYSGAWSWSLAKSPLHRGAREGEPLYDVVEAWLLINQVFESQPTIAMRGRDHMRIWNLHDMQIRRGLTSLTMSVDYDYTLQCDSGTPIGDYTGTFTTWRCHRDMSFHLTGNRAILPYFHTDGFTYGMLSSLRAYTIDAHATAKIINRWVARNWRGDELWTQNPSTPAVGLAVSDNINIISNVGDYRNPGEFTTQPFKPFFKGLGLPADPYESTKYLYDRMEAFMPDIRPTCVLAYADALEKDLVINKTNLIQIAQGLDGLGEIFPGDQDLKDIFKVIASGDRSTIYNLTDKLTSEVLRNSFAASPTQRFVDQIKSADYVASYQKLMSLFAPRSRISYGVFKYTFTESETEMILPRSKGKTILQLETHCKASYSMDLSALLATLMVGDSVGALPTFSRIWEILPFSFVADWLFNTKKRIRVNELLSIGWFATQMHSNLYSYKLSLLPVDGFDRECGLESKDFKVTGYRRELSRLLPIYRNTRIDWLAVKSKPSLVVVGSLAFQLLKL